MTIPRRSGQRWPRFALFALLVAVAALALRWVFLVPIFQAPDEPAHFDYALAIHENGGLFRVSGDLDNPARLVHPDSLFLLDRTAADSIAFQLEGRVPPGYGSATFYDALDRERAVNLSLYRDEPPALAWIYPYGFYTLLAAWIHLLFWLKNSIVLVFFGARMLSVLLLLVSLLCTYGAARELGHSQVFGLLLTSIIGFFPLTLFVSSYVQPDNLSFTFVALAFYLTLVARRHIDSLAMAGVLGLVFGALLVTKPHYSVCTLVPALAMLAVQKATSGAGKKHWTAWVALWILPSLLFGGVYVWTIWDARSYYNASAPCEHFIPFVAHGLRKALQDFYTGTTHRSFWGIFGWMDTPLIIGSETTNAIVRALIRVATWTILALALMRLKQVSAAFGRLTRRGKSAAAWRLILSNPPINSFFLFTVLMLAFYVRTANLFGAQGRNWLPFLMPIFLTGLSYAPRALARQRQRAILSRAVGIGLILFTVLGSYYALRTIRERYYDPNNDQPMSEVSLSASASAIRPQQAQLESEADRRVRTVFRLEKSQFVYAARIHYRLPDPLGDNAKFRICWGDFARASPHLGERQLTYGSHPCPPDKTIQVWINDTIDRIDIYSDEQNGPCEIRELILYRKPS
jgi:4-amino-4-deoxy-L-arabinose transferase-like glycosyltransferase